MTPLLPVSTKAGTPPFKAQQLKLGDAEEITLFVSNLEPFGTIGDEQTGGAFDYLLHYLTAKGGIPLSIARRTPGLPCAPEPLVSSTPAEIAEALKGLACLLDSHGSPAAIQASHFGPEPQFLTPSCSDSQYP